MNSRASPQTPSRDVPGPHRAAAKEEPVDHRSRDSNFSAASLERAERGTMDERSRPRRLQQTPMGNELRVEAVVHRVSTSPRRCSRTASLPNGLPRSKSPKLLIDTAALDRRNDAAMSLSGISIDLDRITSCVFTHARLVSSRHH